MKNLLTAVSAIALTTTGAFAQSLMLDFGPNGITAGAETTSPGHVVGGVPLTQTTWNPITGTAPVSSLNFADGTTATGITLTTGQEATGGNNVISFATAIGNTTALTGSGGGTAGKQSLLGAGSIYGLGGGTPINTAGRDGFFGGGTSTSTGAAIGLRIDGLAVGDYVVYVMARNTNGNGTNAPMNIYTSVGASSATFDFSSLTPVAQANTNYASAGYADQYTTFTAGENYVALSFSIAEGQSLFLAVDGLNDAVERRGFLNMVQIVNVTPVPEPAEVGVLVAGGLGLLALVRRRRTA